MGFARSSRVLFVCSGAALAACAADGGDALKSDDGGALSSDDAAAPFMGEDTGTATADSSAADVTTAANDSSPPPGKDAAGTDDAAAMEAGILDAGGDDVAVATCTSCPLVVDYMTTNTSAMSSTMSPQLEIFNNGASPADMTALTLRYYYTAQGSTSQTFACDYFPGGCGSVVATFVAMATPTATADHYLQIAFTSGSIASGASSGGLQARFYDTTFAVTFDQAQDYSFNPGDTAFTPWNHVTLYRSGALVYGVEP